MRQAPAKLARRAPELHLALAALLEITVMDEEERTFVRAYAWVRLVKLWTGMRWSDTCSTPPALHWGFLFLRYSYP